MKIPRLLLILFIVNVFTTPVLQAAEGMWIPILLKSREADMKKMGFRLTADDLFSMNKSSLKDAVVHFGGGCTAEIVSPEGLILTNHHCGFSQIQSHSSLEHDYLKDGFWAYSKDQELACPGLTVSLIVRIEDVTARVLNGADGKTGVERENKVQANISKIVSELAEKEPDLKADIQPYFYGNQYFMTVTKTYRDVRMVGAPPSSIGKFGGDTDNWMWPRHTGDFSVFRIYADKNNEPADYSADNVPFKPAHYFPVSVKGTKEGDFTLVYGFPGQTQQFLVSTAVEYVTNTMNPQAIAMRGKSLDIIVEAMESSDEIRIQYAAKQARIANGWKKWIGENNGLERLSAIEVKKELEKKYASMIVKDGKVDPVYVQVVQNVQKLYEAKSKYIGARSMLIEFYYVGPEIIRFAKNFENLADNYEELKEKGELDAELEKLKKNTEGFYKNYQPDVDQKILAALYPMYINGLAADLRPDIHKEISTKYGNDFDAYAKDFFATSQLTSREKLDKMLNKFTKKSWKMLKDDPAIKLGRDVVAAWRDKAAMEFSFFDTDLQELMRIYVDGLMRIFPDRQFWPDANSTLRVAYGKIEGSEPRDGVIYKPFTTLDGVVAKYVPGDREFDLPEKLLDLHRRRDYGNYKDPAGNLPVCFTASNHTTGGNSGSPVLDGDGNLIGINFDRSWESTMSDIMYDPERCRNIVLDIRYVLFIMDKYAGATNLIKEMTLKN